MSNVCSGVNMCQWDLLHYLYNATKRATIYDMVSSCRGDEGVSLSYPSDWVGDTVHVYLAFVSESGSLVSNSVYVGEKVIG